MGFNIYIQSSDGRPLPEPDNSYRLNVFAMSKVLDAMESFGMVYEAPIPDDAAQHAAQDASHPEPTGIPEYKLSHSCALLITVAEITAALDRYDAHPGVAMAEAPLGDPTWRDWIAFLRRAKAHGGLRTH